jgi:hypothetical protein
MYMDPDIWQALSYGEREAVFAGQLEFQKTITGSGEMVGTKAMAARRRA